MNGRMLIEPVLPCDHGPLSEGRARQAMKSQQDLSQLARIGISLPRKLLNQLDEMVAERNLPGRSQHGQEAGVLAGTITLIYKAESGRVRHGLAKIQSEFLKEVISSQHVFLEEDKSLEVLLVQGSTERLNSLCDRLRSVRAVQQLKLVTTRTLLPPLHAHSATELEAAQRRAS